MKEFFFYKKAVLSYRNVSFASFVRVSGRMAL